VFHRAAVLRAAGDLDHAAPIKTAAEFVVRPRIKKLGTIDVGKVSGRMAKALPPAYNRPQRFSPGCRHEQHPQKMLDVAIAVILSLVAQAEELVDGTALTGQE